MSKLVALVLTVFALLWGTSQQCRADNYRYDGQTEVANFKDTDRKCSIWINGRSLVQGAYSNDEGQLTLEADGRSEIVLRGKCKGVVIKRLNGQSFIDLSQLEVGDGGISVEDMNGQCRIKCWTKGYIDVKAADGQCTIFYRKGAKGAPNSLNGQSRCVELVDENAK